MIRKDDQPAVLTGYRLVYEYDSRDSVILLTEYHFTPSFGEYLFWDVEAYEYIYDENDYLIRCSYSSPSFQGNIVRNIRFENFCDGLPKILYYENLAPSVNLDRKNSRVFIEYEQRANCEEEGGRFGLKIYPNPSSNYISINHPILKYGNSSFQIFNAQGKLVLYRNQLPRSEKLEIDVRKLSKGIYLIRLENESESISDRFFKL